jgi:predicted peroxiredoxin
MNRYKNAIFIALEIRKIHGIIKMWKRKKKAQKLSWFFPLVNLNDQTLEETVEKCREAGIKLLLVDKIVKIGVVEAKDAKALHTILEIQSYNFINLGI